MVMATGRSSANQNLEFQLTYIPAILLALVFFCLFPPIRTSQRLIASSSQALGGLLAHLSRSLRTVKIHFLWEKLVTCRDEPF